MKQLFCQHSPSNAKKARDNHRKRITDFPKAKETDHFGREIVAVREGRVVASAAVNVLDKTGIRFVMRKGKFESVDSEAIISPHNENKELSVYHADNPWLHMHTKKDLFSGRSLQLQPIRLLYCNLFQPFVESFCNENLHRNRQRISQEQSYPTCVR